jgi:hypothetical protein
MAGIFAVLQTNGLLPTSDVCFAMTNMSMKSRKFRQGRARVFVVSYESPLYSLSNLSKIKNPATVISS